MNKLITGLHNRLMRLIDEGHVMYFAERPFLDGGGFIITPNENSKQNAIEIEETVQALTKAVKDSIPAPIPPKQLDFHT